MKNLYDAGIKEIKEKLWQKWSHKLYPFANLQAASGQCVI